MVSWEKVYAILVMANYIVNRCFKYRVLVRKDVIYMASFFRLGENKLYSSSLSSIIIRFQNVNNKCYLISFNNILQH